ncbi:hypothetical protein CEUSTIGMA_g12843.t1 [Chlamydomonas eustigma]|uniref:Radical SAM core domain-containing protein n=1 Tax=Chlamydomonas eustigma TaxID=1157962 RepID=A0A250XQT3_9CHLO|nr:hypothetical protein CEUSTIGMA_g12843.t1 [Chlamydomonas eustigma]|eukprot:GAX85427.1 hypothetical protein CEUSTIGMA_g12843.t1 [Chlamydomonas eustigma]
MTHRRCPSLYNLFLNADEVVAIAQLGATQGCTEALFTLGDKPELKWPEAAEELKEMGFNNTIDYVHFVAQQVLLQTGLLPHINAGVMSEVDLRRLKEVSASQGLMLESLSPQLLMPGGAHHDCPDKEPVARLETLRAAGRAAVPFTTGILIGIGETRQDRLLALLAIRDMHEEYGHIQEVIVQNFRAKKGTAMYNHPEPDLEELLWTVSAARIILGSEMNLQAPPNLTPGVGETMTGLRASWAALIGAGINDWGGISPVTRDYVNPEKPWPHLGDLADVTASCGFHLLPRLPLYPEYLPLLSSKEFPLRKMSCKGDTTSATFQQQAQSSSPNMSPHLAGLPKAVTLFQGAPDGVAAASSSEEACWLFPGGGKDGILAAKAWLFPGGGKDGILAATLRHSDSTGYVRGSTWYAGLPDAGEEMSKTSFQAMQQRAHSSDSVNGSTSVPAEVDVPGPEVASNSNASSFATHYLQDYRDSGSESSSSPTATTTTTTTTTSSIQTAPYESCEDHPAGDTGAASSSTASTTTTTTTTSSIPKVRLSLNKAWSVSLSYNGIVQGLPGLAPPSHQVLSLLKEVMSFAEKVSSKNCSFEQEGQTQTGPEPHSGDVEVKLGGPWLSSFRKRKQQPILSHVNEAAASYKEQTLLQRSPSNPLGQEEVELLLRCRGADMDAVCAAADNVRRMLAGDVVTYVVNRNINYTNVCTLKCQFCAFSKGKAEEELRGLPYVVPLKEITRRTAEAWSRGATEVCMQGGIHPDFTGHTYLAILKAAKKGAPGVHVHAFSPLEVYQGASSLGIPLTEYLEMLKDAGLGSLPGTAAEVLDDSVRSTLCPDKINTQQWLEVVEAAHTVGLPTTSTLMFGHIEEGPSTWAKHLMEIRSVAERTGGISEFVPLPFVHMQAPIYLKGASRRGPTLRECVLLHAVARLALFPSITNIQASWVKMGPKHASALLASGCNDMGGVLMNESITRAAGAAHGQEMDPSRMEDVIRQAGRVPKQRTTLYGEPDPDQVLKSFQFCTSSYEASGMRSSENKQQWELDPLIFAKPGTKLVG